jgi:hypothetical protein
MLRAASAIFMPCCLNSRAKDALKPEPAPTINADENCVLSIAVSLSDCTVKWRAFQRLPEELQIAGSVRFGLMQLNGSVKFQKYPLPDCRIAFVKRTETFNEEPLGQHAANGEADQTA